MGIDPFSLIFLAAVGSISAEEKRQGAARDARAAAEEERLAAAEEERLAAERREQVGVDLIAGRAVRAPLVAAQTRLGRRASFLGQVSERSLLTQQRGQVRTGQPSVGGPPRLGFALDPGVSTLL